MQLPMKALPVVSLLCAPGGAAQAQYSDGVIRIGEGRSRCHYGLRVFAVMTAYDARQAA
jgi:hypothetical protein